MKIRVFFCLIVGAWLSSGVVAAQQSSVVAMPPTGSASYNGLVLQQIATMPRLGGYSASHQATQRLTSALLFTTLGGLNIEAARAQPSYCSGATYLVFLKTVGALCRGGALTLDDRSYGALLVNGQRDGEGIWGRWNANGPGTARLFYEMRLGKNFDEFAQAAPGDFMKIFWSSAVGRREHGHSVVFLGTGLNNGVDSVHFWSSNIGVGYSDKWVPRARISAAVFSRLSHPQNLATAATLTPTTDPYLAGLLTKDSSLAEVHEKCGL